MGPELTIKTILDRCGTVSFKRGESFYYKNKVSVQVIQPDYWKAVVKGNEDFHVSISNPNNELKTDCSCPKLASVDQDCQHIASVLIALYHQQQKQTGVPKIKPRRMHSGKDASQDFLTIFDKKRNTRAISEQTHFETRTRVSLKIQAHVLDLETDHPVMGVSLQVDELPVQSIQEFLLSLKAGQAYPLSQARTFDLNHYCFSKTVEPLIQELIVCAEDETSTSKDSGEKTERTNPNQLILLPSVWHRFVQHLTPSVEFTITFKGSAYSGYRTLEDLLPLTFQFEEVDAESIQLLIQGLDEVFVLKDYGLAWCEGLFKRLETEDATRLWDVQRMLAAQHGPVITIPKRQSGVIKKQILPSLRRLGRVIGVEVLRNTYKPPELKAKLYLDRIRNRLLAGLEFHYNELIIDPFDDQTAHSELFVERDLQKETHILALIKESQFTETDGGFYLHNEALEFQFLTQQLPKLQKWVEVLATTAVRTRVSKNTFRPQIRVRVKKDRTNWLEFKFEMEGISNDDIRSVLGAIEEKKQYYRLPNDTLLSLETEDFDEVRRLLLKPKITAEDLLSGLNLTFASSLELLESVEGRDIFQFDESYQAVLEKLSHPERAEFDVPKRFESVLRSYQKTGFKWLKTLAHYGFGGVLADDMGLGKTVQAIAYIESELAAVRNTGRPILIVCPSSLTYNWLNELQTFAPETNTKIIEGTPKKRRNLLKAQDGVDVFITSYPMVRSDVSAYEKTAFHTIFFDEAQSFKNPLSQTARTVKRLDADHRFALTGTPLENALEELWAVYHVVFPELFLSIREFSTLSKADITKRIRPFMLRRMKREVLSELPEKHAATDPVDLFPEQKSLYAAYLAKLRHDTLKHLDQETRNKNRIKILAGLTRLRQICCHPSLFIDGYSGRSAKFEHLLSLLDQAQHSGRRVLVFSQFTKMLGLIRRELIKQGRSFFYLDGETPSEERVALCNQFNGGERDVFLISLKAGGTGLNLIGADTVILYDTWWNPAVEEQATDRAYRMGQKKDVQVIKLISTGTVEEKMSELQDKKRALIDEMIDSDRPEQPKLSDEELKQILTGNLEWEV